MEHEARFLYVGSTNCIVRRNMYAAEMNSPPVFLFFSPYALRSQTFFEAIPKQSTIVIDLILNYYLNHSDQSTQYMILFRYFRQSCIYSSKLPGGIWFRFAFAFIVTLSFIHLFIYLFFVCDNFAKYTL